MAEVNHHSCMWDSSEFLLKASLERKEAPMLKLWVDAYSVNMLCFPRLHVITYSHSLPAARRAFSQIPNVTFHDNQFAPIIESQHERRFIIIQWHLMWADNITTAPYVIFFDVDSPIMLPMRCHHLFDDDDRPYWHYWIKGSKSSVVPMQRCTHTRK